MRPARMIQTLKAAGQWQPHTHEDWQWQIVGLSNHIGYVGALLLRNDGHCRYLCTDVSKEEAFFFVAGEREVQAAIRRHVWLSGGGDSALLKELETC